MATKTRRAIMFSLGMVAAWTVAAWIGGRIAQPDREALGSLGPGGLAPSDDLTWQAARALVAGVFSGLVASLLELKLLPPFARRVGAGTMLIGRTIVYAAVGLCSVAATARFVARRELGIPVAELFSSEGFQTFLRSPDFGAIILTFVIASFIINGGYQVARLLGPRTVTQILLGRYVKPIHEDRAFLFVDLVDSTGIAERLGPLRFAEFKNDFFHDIAEPVLNSRGQIVQYVGDEVMITWPIRAGTQAVAGDCLGCFFALRSRIARRATQYEAKYGMVPRFRAGLHSGSVVVSQLGDIKRDIVFSGDAVNTAARIQGLCKELGRDFLASGEVMKGLAVQPGVAREALGEHTLRGRAAPVSLVALAVG